MYLSSYEMVMSMDMQAPDPPLTLDTLAYYDGFSTPEPFNTGFWIPQQHEDGKLYYATTNGTLALHVIHHPELPGLAADIEQHAIKLPVYNDGTMCRFPNYRLGILAGSPCDTLQFSGSGDGFTNIPYSTEKPKKGEDYKILSPIRGNGSSQEPHFSVLEYGINAARKAKLEKEKALQTPAQDH